MAPRAWLITWPSTSAVSLKQCFKQISKYVQRIVLHITRRMSILFGMVISHFVTILYSKSLFIKLGMKYPDALSQSSVTFSNEGEQYSMTLMSSLKPLLSKKWFIGMKYIHYVICTRLLEICTFDLQTLPLCAISILAMHREWAEFSAF